MPNQNPTDNIWEAMSTANWDLQDHPTEIGPYFQMGSIGAVPSGRQVSGQPSTHPF